MIRLGLGVIVLALALLVPGSAQDKKEVKKADESGKMYKGTLPPNYGKLKLSDQQKQAIYKVQTEYKKKLDDLEKQKAKLVADRKADYEKVLTKEQKQKLREILTGEKD